MGQILVRNLDDSVVISLKAKAKAAGKSLEQYLRDNLTDIALSGTSLCLEKAREFREAQPAFISLDDLENAVTQSKIELDTRNPVNKAP